MKVHPVFMLSLLAAAHSCAFAADGAVAEPIAFPIKVAEGKHTFADAKGKPFFWLGTTQWELFRGYAQEDARIILEKTRDNGFTVVQVKLLGQGDGNRTNVYGHKPLLNGDALTPNEAYFTNVDAVVKAARDHNLVILMTVFHQSYRKNIPLDKARVWAKWLATRYAGSPNVIWSTTPEAKMESVPILREIAAGLREGDPLHRPISFKPDPAPAPSSSFINEEPWLDFNAMQVWNALEKIYPMLTADYALQPVKPTLMAEGAYEAGEEYGFAVTPLWVRRQAYYSYLAGGHHSYGHNDSWRIRPTWKQSLDAPGARQMGILRRIFEARPEWWLLEPDQSLFVTGGKTDGRVLHLAARHHDGQWAMFYLGDPAEFSVNLGRLRAAKLNATWINPANGQASPLGALSNQGVKSFTTPEGWDDSLLVIESPGGKAKPLAGAEAAAPPLAVPMVHATDLFRPHNDPDDHWDLACVYALAFQGRIELKGVLIDFPPPALHTDPDVSAVAQLNYLTSQAAPALVGASRTLSRDQARDAALQADLGGIRAVLEMLRRSPQPVVLNVVGSTRDIAIAGGLEPELFAKKCAGIYLNAGSGSPDKARTKRLEYNVGLDPASYAAIFQLPCPVYWMPCFEDAGEFRVAEFGTFYQFRQDLVLPRLSDRLQNFFAFMYQRGPQANWLQYVLAPKEVPLLAQQGTLSRNMWCTAGFLHAVGLTVSRDGRILPQAEAADAVFSFTPIRIQCAPDGVTQWTPDATAKNRFIFHVRDLQNYPSAMISALRSLLAQLP